MPARHSVVRLVHVTNSPFSLRYFFGGQLAFLRAQGFEIHLVCPAGEGLDRFAEYEGVRTHPVPIGRSISPLADLVSVYHVWRVLRRLRPEIVHGHTPKGGLVGLLAGWLARVPVRVYHVRGLPLMTATGVKHSVLRLTERVACALATQVLSVSHSIREAVVSQRLCGGQKIKVLLRGSGNGVDATGRFDPARYGESVRLALRAEHGIPADAVVVGFVGRLIREKGARELVEACRSLQAQYPQLHLLVVGPFEPHDPVAPEIVEYMHTSDRIHLTGQVSDTAPLYTAMDVVCLPSYREGFPNVPMEAAAMGLPVVASDVPGCTDAVLREITGLLVPARETQALAMALQRYLESPALRREHGLAGQVRVRRDFRREAVWRALHGEYLQLLTARGLRLPVLGASAPAEPPEVLAQVPERERPPVAV